MRSKSAWVCSRPGCPPALGASEPDRRPGLGEVDAALWVGDGAFAVGEPFGEPAVGAGADVKDVACAA
jgi:hypothetical protein